MKIVFNNKEYHIEDNYDTTLRQFIIENNLVQYNLDDNYIIDLNYFDVDSNENLVYIDDIILSDNLKISTESKKYYNNIKKQMMDEYLMDNVSDNIELNPDYYNVLLCDPELYPICYEKYYKVGFNDIVNLKFASMIEYIERAHELMLNKSDMFDSRKNKQSIYRNLYLLTYQDNLVTKIDTDENIAIKLINNYFAKTLHIEKPINYIYITNSKIKYFNNQLNKNKLINQIVYTNKCNIKSIEKCFDGKISNHIYQKECMDYNIKCSFTGFIRLLSTMGLKEQSIEINTLDENTKEIIANYSRISIKGLITSNYLTKEELLNYQDYDYIYILSDNESIYYNVENYYIYDHNINEIYKRYLMYPGYSKLIKK